MSHEIGCPAILYKPGIHCKYKNTGTETENPYLPNGYAERLAALEKEITGMVMVHETDLQGIEDFLDYWANPRKSSPPLNILTSKAKELKKRCEYARKGYPPGTLAKEQAAAVGGEPQERTTNPCEVCGKPTYGKRCHLHAN